MPKDIIPILKISESVYLVSILVLTLVSRVINFI